MQESTNEPVECTVLTLHACKYISLDVWFSACVCVKHIAADGSFIFTIFSWIWKCLQIIHVNGYLCNWVRNEFSKQCLVKWHFLTVCVHDEEACLTRLIAFSRKHPARMLSWCAHLPALLHQLLHVWRDNGTIIIASARDAHSWWWIGEFSDITAYKWMLDMCFTPMMRAMLNESHFHIFMPTAFLFLCGPE